MAKARYKQPSSHPRVHINWAVIIFLLTITALTIDWWLLLGRYQGDSSYAVIFENPVPTITPLPHTSPVNSNPTTPTPIPSSTPTTVALPPSVLINVPFQIQAPHNNWDALHEETCEETVLLMVQHFFARTSFPDQDAADLEIKNIVQYETDHNYTVDVTLEELTVIADNYFHMSTARIVTNPTVALIKQELASGRPVIIPAAGRELHNPYFKQPGPIYHMLVIKGYDDITGEFVTNDPGIRQGNGYRYPYDTLLKAVHNWNKDNILVGTKEYLVFN